MDKSSTLTKFDAWINEDSLYTWGAALRKSPIGGFSCCRCQSTLGTRWCEGVEQSMKDIDRRNSDVNDWWSYGETFSEWYILPEPNPYSMLA